MPPGGALSDFVSFVETFPMKQQLIHFSISYLYLETVVCKWCGRSFSRRASEKHIPFCEKWTKENGRPMTPSYTQYQRSKTDRAKEVS